MCGIFLWVNQRRQINPARASRAVLSMRHRGPDHQAIHVFSDGNHMIFDDLEKLSERNDAEIMQADVVLGHARLSIIDLAASANQPMLAKDGTAIIFNGTIYNYIELRQDLKNTGQSFATNSDTEVLLHWLRKNGIGNNTALNGSWAFAFYEPDKKTVTLSRDPYGERPLYYYHGGENFIAASEIKAISEALGRPALKFETNQFMAFLAYGNWSPVNATETMYSDIQRAPPGGSLVLTLKDQKLRAINTNPVERYFTGSPDPMEIGTDLNSAANIRLRSDVPVGVTVSGGIDSSAITALLSENSENLSKLKFYTARYPEGVSNDLVYAKALAENLGIELTEVEIPYVSNAMEHLNIISRFYDQPIPFAGSTLSESAIYRKMAADGIRVVISGTGGDEVFGGYGNEYIEGAANEYFQSFKFFKLARFISDALNTGYTSRSALALLIYKNLTRRIRDNSPMRRFKQFVKPDFIEALNSNPNYYWGRNALRSNLKEVQLEDCIRGRLVYYVTFSDLNGMMNSLETRCPFLDPNLIKFMQMSPECKYHDGYNKFALRKALPKIVGNKISWRKQKQGFTYPFAEFFQGNKPEILDTIKRSEHLAEVFELDGIIGALDASPIGMKLLLNLFSVAVFIDFRSRSIDQSYSFS
jgi:asparagine synthase (glutamine-hydrolysing)